MSNKKFDDYRATRAIVDDPKVYTSAQIRAGKLESSLYVHIPKEIENDMGITSYNYAELRMILVKKSEVLENGRGDTGRDMQAAATDRTTTD